MFISSLWWNTGFYEGGNLHANEEYLFVDMEGV